MRPSNRGINLKYLPTSTLKIRLKNKKITEKTKTKIYNILTDRKEKTSELVKKFFNTEHNKFLRLAQWQLYREGKATLYSDGHKKRFKVDNFLMLFDKMIEVKAKYDQYMNKKHHESDGILDNSYIDVDDVITERI